MISSCWFVHTSAADCGCLWQPCIPRLSGANQS